MAKQDVDVVRRFYDTYLAGDFEGFFGTLDPGIEWIEPEAPDLPFGGKTVGLEALQTLFADVGDFWEEFTPYADRFIDAGDAVVVVGGYNAKHRGSGVDVSTPYVHISEVRDGKIVRTRFYEDVSEWLPRVTEAAGASK